MFMLNVDVSPRCLCLFGLLLFPLLVRHNPSLLVFALFICALWNSFLGQPGIFAWCRVVQRNTEWYSEVQCDTAWYRNTGWNRVIQIGAEWYRSVQHCLRFPRDLHEEENCDREVMQLCQDGKWWRKLCLLFHHIPDSSPSHEIQRMAPVLSLWDAKVFSSADSLLCAR